MDEYQRIQMLKTVFVEGVKYEAERFYLVPPTLASQWTVGDDDTRIANVDTEWEPD